MDAINIAVMPADSSPETTSLAKAWNAALSCVAVGNAIAWLVIASRKSTDAPLSLSWRGMWGTRRALAFVYVVACGTRSIWPRMDGDRVCFWDHPLSPPLVGRSLAFVAELCFAALVCMTLTRVIGSALVRRVASFALAFNVIAQLCCTYGVITKDQRAHVVEESIWAATGFVVCLISGVALWGGKRTSLSPSQSAQTFLRLMTFGGAAFCVFMVTVDVPMYVRRAQADAASHAVFGSIAGGLAEMARCVRFTQADAYWKEEMPWMSGYFTFAVWLMLWLASVDIDSAPGADSEDSRTHSKQQRSTASKKHT